MYADFGHPIADPTPVFEDNESCQKLVENYCGHDKVKHLHIRMSVVREHNAHGFIEMKRVPDGDQLADVFTKVKAGPQMRRFRDWMLTGQLPDDCAITETLRSVGHVGAKVSVARRSSVGSRVVFRSSRFLLMWPA